MDKLDLRIIIIDDNPNIHKDIIKVLSLSKKSTRAFDDMEASLFENNNDSEMIGTELPEFQFETACQGREGVKKIKEAVQEGKPFSLAFVDIRMPPGWDGIQTIQQLWKVDPNVQIVICTAFSDYSWEETIEKLGVNDNFLILKKPFDSVAVRQLACALTRKWILAKNSKSYTDSLKITVDKQTENLQKSLSLLRATLDSSIEGIFVTDLKNKLVDYNIRLSNLLEIPKNILEQKNENILQKFIISKLEDSAPYLMQLKAVYMNSDIKSRQVIHFKNGMIFECTSQPYRLNVNTLGRVWSFRDITEREVMEQKLQYQAMHDALTNLPNRLLLHDRIKQAIISSSRTKTSFAVLFLDLDRFKLVNDSLGHEFGDRLLCAVAKRLSSLIRKEDTLSRLGGDEFVLVLTKLPDEQSILNLSQKIIMSFQKPFVCEGHEINLNTSIGISMYPANGKTVESLLKNADLAMYKAKDEGGNLFKFYTTSLNRKSTKKLKFETELRNALKNHEFYLLYQPQLNLKDQNFLSVEALIRWNHPEKGVIFPHNFIPAAEDSGLIVPIGEWVIRKVCEQIQTWRQEGFLWISVAINVAVKQLKYPNFDKIVAGILKEFEIPAECLEIEITENVIVTQPEVKQMINRLRKLGLKIILDDFGTGNSSLNYLKQIHVDRLKIDRSFIMNISKSRTNEVIIEAVIAMAKNLHFKVLAEGVEEPNQIDFLKSNECNEVQGYYYSKPLEPSAVINYVKHHLEEK
jgi:diguanylate cyclase (GGDEF)-like protein